MKKGCEAAVFFHDNTTGENFLVLCELKVSRGKGALEQIKGGYLATRYLTSFALLNSCQQRNILNFPDIKFTGVIATERKGSRLRASTDRKGDIVYLHGPQVIHLQRILR